ncbi:MAG: 1-deoxy-D-xylulose-5-phosphate reductoisomerase [Armatimonadota bacterium]
MKRVAILGSTGSIGQQTLDVIDRLPNRVRVVALAAHSNLDLLLEQAERFGVEAVGLLCPPEQIGQRLPEKLERAGKRFRLHTGIEGLCELVRRPEIDMVVVALAGMIALQPTLAAIEAGKTIALSTKEVLVGAGEYVMQRARAYGVPILPIDSEHSGAFQILHGRSVETVERLILTASGGPFRQRPLETFEAITVQEALQHPNWRMGPKVTVDAATMMNKGLEVIEAHWLFGLPLERIEVLVHPQSIVHALVEFRDGSVLAQLSLPDMRLPIQYALLHPERVDTELPRLRLEQVRCLEFETPDLERYPCLRLAYEAARVGGTMPAVLNAANEVAVQLFLQERIPFTAIATLVEQTMQAHEPREATLQAVLEADSWARDYVRRQT